MPRVRQLEKIPVRNKTNLWRAGSREMQILRSLAAIGGENACCAPAIPSAEWSSANAATPFQDMMSFPDDLTQEAERLREEAEKLPPGTERHDLERKARQAETAAHIDEWLESPGLRPPE
jgi:hypothetical protein